MDIVLIVTLSILVLYMIYKMVRNYNKIYNEHKCPKCDVDLKYIKGKKAYYCNKCYDEYKTTSLDD